MTPTNPTNPNSPNSPPAHNTGKTRLPRRAHEEAIEIHSERLYACAPDGTVDPGTPSELAMLTITVPIYLRHHRDRPGPDTLEVGEVGEITPGSRDLAINILSYLYPVGCDGREPVRCRVNLASQTAYSLHERFCADFLAPMEPAGGEIPGEKIRSWVERRLPSRGH